jgi:hypothetical protein
MYKKYRKILILSLIGFVTVFPIFLSFYPNFNYSSDINEIDIEPKLNSFSKEDYKPILDAPNYGLGYINLTRLVSFNEKGIINYSLTFPELDDDISSGALNISYIGTNYIKTVQVAQFNNLDTTVIKSDKIKILMNESISVEYNSSKEDSEGFMIYNPRLYPRDLKQILVQNQSSSIIEELNSEDYILNSDGFIKFSFKNYFKTNYHNFSMYVIFEYSLELLNWNINQDQGNVLQMTSSQHVYSPEFSYNFTLKGTKRNFNKTLVTILANNLYVELILNPLDKELFYDHQLLIDNKKINDYLELDKSLKFNISAGQKSFILNFKINFTICFLNDVDFAWAIDRLVEGRNIRERIYLPSLISGPQYIFLKNVTFIENTINVDQVISNSSIFERNVNYIDVIISITQQSVEHSLIFTQNAVKRKGLRIFVPYIILGETNPIILKYRANNNLKIIITDNINMPLVGSKVELYYYEKLFGTYISNDLNQPMAPVYSNENGEVIIEGLPNGNYTIRIYQNNQLIKKGLINTFSQIVIIQSNAIHFPVWIIIFGSISFILVLVGFIFYFKNKKRK